MLILFYFTYMLSDTKKKKIQTGLKLQWITLCPTDPIIFIGPVYKYEITNVDRQLIKS